MKGIDGVKSSVTKVLDCMSGMETQVVTSDSTPNPNPNPNLNPN